MNEQELGITPQNYLDRNTIFRWDLTASQVGSGMCYETLGTFTVDLVMLIHTTLTHAVEILVYAEYDAEIEIDRKGKVKVHENALEMDSHMCEKLLLKDPRTRLLFRGVYLSDTLPPNAEEGLYIVNEAKSHEPGTHWISLHITPKKRKNVYFDSYG